MEQSQVAAKVVDGTLSCALAFGPPAAQLRQFLGALEVGMKSVEVVQGGQRPEVNVHTESIPVKRILYPA
jgi:hypothetical protein